MPVHELVKAAGLLYDLMTGSEIEMIGVSQNNLRTQFLHILRLHGLYRGLSAYRHEYRSLDVTVRRVDGAETRPGPLISFI